MLLHILILHSSLSNISNCATLFVSTYSWLNSHPGARRKSIAYLHSDWQGCFIQLKTKLSFHFISSSWNVPDSDFSVLSTSPRVNTLTHLIYLTVNWVLCSQDYYTKKRIIWKKQRVLWISQKITLIKTQFGNKALWWAFLYRLPWVCETQVYE